MFDIAPSEFLLIAIVAIVVIGPKDLPMALRTAGRWIARVRRVSNHFKSGIETMIREAEMEEMERKWREQNAAIMADNPPVDPAAVVDAAGVEHPCWNTQQSSLRGSSRLRSSRLGSSRLRSSKRQSIR